MFEWSHLPNAVYIDQILAHVKTNPEKWEAANGTMYASAWDAAWNAALDAAWNAAGNEAAWNAANAARTEAAWDAARKEMSATGWNAAWGAILALLTYPDCAYMLNMSPEQIKIYAGLDVRGAVLLLPAVIAMEKENDN